MELIDTEKDYVRDLGLLVEVCNLVLINNSNSNQIFGFCGLICWISIQT